MSADEPQNSSPPLSAPLSLPLPPLKIGELTLAHPTILAPMEGVTDRPFRGLIRGFGGCGLTVTEFVSSEGMKRHDPKAWRQAELGEGERPVSIQIYGREPVAMAEAARACEGLGADIIDINLGCPSKSVTSGSSGSALMREPERAYAIFKAVRAAIKVPMTVKMRLGWDEQRLNAPEVAYQAQEEGASLVTVHGRTREQMYRGVADWAAIRLVKERLSVPLVVNGDILTDHDALRALELSGADGVMIGRGALRDPWVFQRVAHALRGEPFEEPSLRARRDALLHYFDLLSLGVRSEQHAVGRLKKVLGFFTRGLPYGEALREEAFHLHELEAIYACARAYFERLEREGLTESFSSLHGAYEVGAELSSRDEKFAVFQR